MQLISFFKKIDRFLDRQTLLLLLLVLIIILRLPNFFEPYWYGDEAIYLTLGNALKQGGQLYTTIIDHKTPLIYYLAMVPNQLYFRVLNLCWMLATTTFFFYFAKKLFKKESKAFLASLILVILTSLPWLEGNIPNGELFVMGFVMLGAVFFTHSSIFTNLLQKELVFKQTLKDGLILSAAGAMMGLGILTKVPALLDAAAFLAIFALLFSKVLFNPKNEAKMIKQSFFYLANRGLFFGLGLITPILISILYFVSKGQGQDYLDYGLLYNFRYSQSWSLDLGNDLLNFAFSMAGKTIILFILFSLIILNHEQLKKSFQFISLYFIFALYSVLLSNRPYPHYFIQMVPALALLLVETFSTLQTILRKHKQKKILGLGKTLVLSAGLLSLTIYIMLSLNFKPYSTVKYYKQFYKYATLQISKEEYENSFDSLVAENRQVSQLIKEMGLKKIFIWGTNPLLYAQSHTIPTSRFTVSFHIKDFGDHDRTMAQIRQEKPKLIIVMNNETDNFPQLTSYLQEFYLENNEFQHMRLYLRR